MRLIALTKGILEEEALGLILIGLDGVIIVLARPELRFEGIGVGAENSIKMAASFGVSVLGFDPASNLRQISKKNKEDWSKNSGLHLSF